MQPSLVGRFKKAQKEGRGERRIDNEFKLEK
jgi:hypothetical protein